MSLHSHVCLGRSGKPCLALSLTLCFIHDLSLGSFFFWNTRLFWFSVFPGSAPNLSPCKWSIEQRGCPSNPSLQDAGTFSFQWVTQFYVSSFRMIHSLPSHIENKTVLVIWWIWNSKLFIANRFETNNLGAWDCVIGKSKSSSSPCL